MVEPLNTIETVEEGAAALARWVKAGLPIVSREVRQERLEQHCHQCEHWTGLTCNLCHCFMAAKTWLATASCPDVPPRWTATVKIPVGGWFFSLADNAQKLHVELESWRGTRFSRAAGGRARKGVSCDCVSFVESVLVNVGVIQPIDWPPYVTHGGGEAMLELLEGTLAKLTRLTRFDGWPPDGPMIGDVILVSSGKALHHLSIYGGNNTVWHATERDRGVGTCNVFDPMIRKHARAFYRARAW